MRRKRALWLILVSASLIGGGALALFSAHSTEMEGVRVIPTLLTHTVPTEEAAPPLVPRLAAVPPARVASTVSGGGSPLRVVVVDAVRGTPIPSARAGIVAGGLDDGSMPRGDFPQGLTDQAGEVRLPAPSQGPAMVVVNHADYAPAERTIEAGVHAEAVRVEMTGRLPLAGRAIDMGSRLPIPGVAIGIAAVKRADVTPDASLQRPGLESERILTGSDGTFSTSVAPGSYRMTILSDDHALHWESGVDQSEVFDGSRLRVVRAGDTRIELRLSVVRYLRMKVLDVDTLKPIHSFAELMLSYNPGGRQRLVAVEAGPVALGGTVVHTDSLSSAEEGSLTRRVRFGQTSVPSKILIDFAAPGYAGTSVECRLVTASELSQEHTVTVVRMKRCAPASSRLRVRAVGLKKSSVAVQSDSLKLTALAHSRRDCEALQIWSVPASTDEWVLEPWPAGEWEVELEGGLCRTSKGLVSISEGGEGTVELMVIEQGLRLRVQEEDGGPLPAPRILVSGEPQDSTGRFVVGVEGVAQLGPAEPMKNVALPCKPWVEQGAVLPGEFWVPLWPGRYQIMVQHAGFLPEMIDVECLEGSVARATASLAVDESR